MRRHYFACPSTDTRQSFLPCHLGRNAQEHRLKPVVRAHEHRRHLLRLRCPCTQHRRPDHPSLRVTSSYRVPHALQTHARGTAKLAGLDERADHCNGIFHRRFYPAAPVPLRCGGRDCQSAVVLGRHHGACAVGFRVCQDMLCVGLGWQGECSKGACGSCADGCPRWDCRWFGNGARQGVPVHGASVEGVGRVG